METQNLTPATFSFLTVFEIPLSQGIQRGRCTQMQQKEAQQLFIYSVFAQLKKARNHFQQKRSNYIC